MRFRFILAPLSLGALALLNFTIPAVAQSTGPIAAAPFHAPSPDLSLPEAHIRVDASLVLIPTQVSTEIGAPITNLKPENFRIYEDGVEQRISHFAKDDAPISIGIVFDSSGSMQNKMRKSVEAAQTFFKTANAEDEFFLVDFNERPRLAVPFTPNSDDVYRRIKGTHPFGRTSLFDAIELAIRQMKHAKNSRKALVILSDGGDNRSRMTFSQVKTLLQEADVLMYSMGIFDRADSVKDISKLPKEEQDGPKVLDELTELTGGRNYRVDDLNELPDISDRIGRQLRSQYLIGYTPSNDDRDGKYRRITLSLDAASPGKLRVQYRTGYYAPQQ